MFKLKISSFRNKRAGVTVVDSDESYKKELFLDALKRRGDVPESLTDSKKTASRRSFRNTRAFRRYSKTFPDVSDYLKELKDSVYNQREVKTTYNKSSDSGSFTWRSHVDTHGMDKDFVLEVILKNGNAVVTLDNEMIDKFKYIDGSGDWSIRIDTYEFMKRYEKSMRKVREYILGR